MRSTRSLVLAVAAAVAAALLGGCSSCPAESCGADGSGTCTDAVVASR